MLGLPLAGSFRFSPVVDAFFAPGVEIYTLDLEVVGPTSRLKRKPAGVVFRESTSGRSAVDPTATDGKKTGGWAM